MVLPSPPSPPPSPPRATFAATAAAAANAAATAATAASKSENDAVVTERDTVSPLRNRRDGVPDGAGPFLR